MRYFRPQSLTWWSGIAAILLGAAGILWPGDQVDGFSVVLAQLLGGGDASPAGLILLGAGIIGLRDKMERG